MILYNWHKVFSIVPTESIIRDNQQEYYNMLEEAGNEGNSTCFIEFMLKMILMTIKSSVKGSVNTEVQILYYI